MSLRCAHDKSVLTRDGYECARCKLSWRIALRERREAKKAQKKLMTENKEVE